MQCVSSPIPGNDWNNTANGLMKCSAGLSRASGTMCDAIARSSTSLTGALEHLNPLAILARGYSVTRTLPDGTLVKDASEVKSGDMLSTKLHKGEVISRVR